MHPTLINDNSYIWNAYVPIPVEITRYIISLVNLQSVSSVSRTCKLFDEIVKTRDFWQTQCKQELKSFNPLCTRLDINYKHYLIQHKLIQDKSLREKTWEQVKKDTFQFDRNQVPEDREAPILELCENGTAVLFGGTPFGLDDAFPGLWYLDIINKKVSKPQIQGYPLDFALDRHSGVAVGNKVYYFGGLLKGVKINDVYCVDTEKNTFTKVPCGGEKPSPRTDHPMVLIPGNKLFLYGGSDVTVSPIEDSYILHLDTLMWEKVTIKGQSPGKRSAHTLLAWDNLVFLYGGGQWNNQIRKWHQTFNDMFVFRVDTREWISIKTEGVLPMNDTFVQFYRKGYYLFVSFGGKKNSTRITGETFAYDIVENTWIKYTASEHITDSVDVHFGNDVWFYGAYMYNIMFQVLKMKWLDEYDKIVALEGK